MDGTRKSHADVLVPKYMVDCGVGIILAHHGENYKNELPEVVGYALEHTLWPKYPMKNSVLKVASYTIFATGRGTVIYHQSKSVM